MKKLYYSIGEVAEILGESTSLVRFWANSFPKLIDPVRNAKGNRQFTEQDVEVFKQIHFLVKESGMTLDGAQKKLTQGKDQLANNVKILDSLRSMRSQLEEIRKSL